MAARVAKVLFGLVGVFGLAVVAILTIEPTLDLSGHRDRVSSRLSVMLNRDVGIDGTIAVTVGRHARLRFSDLRIANPDWADRPDLLQVSKADIGIDLWALTKRLVHIEHVRLEGVDVFAETSTEGLDSWSFPQAQSESVDEPAGWRPVVAEAVIDRAALEYHDARDSSSVRVMLDRIRQHQAGKDLVFEAGGLINGLPLSLSGQAGTLEGILAARDIDLAINASLGTATFDLNGSLGRPTELEDIDLSLVLRSNNLVELADAFDLEQPLVGSADLLVQIEDRDRGIAWSTVGNLGEHLVETRGVVEAPLEFDGVSLAFDLRGPDLAVVAEAFDVDGLPVGPYQLSGALRRSAQLIAFEGVDMRIGNSALTLNGSLPELPSVSNAALDFDLVLEDAGIVAEFLEGAPPISGPLHATADLQALDSGRTLVDSRLEWQGSVLSLVGEVGAKPDYAGSQLRFESSGPDLGALAALAGVDVDLPKAFVVLGDVGVDEQGRIEVKVDRSKVGTVGISALGSLGIWPELNDTDLSVQLFGESFRGAFSDLVNLDLPAQGFAIDVAVTGPLVSPLIRRVDARIGEHRFQADGRIAPLPPHDGTDATFELAVNSLVDWAPELGDEAWASRPYSAEGRLKWQGNRLLLENALLNGATTEWRFNGEINDRFDLASARVRASTKGSDGGQYLPQVAGYEPAKSPFQLSLDLASQPNLVLIRDLKLFWADAELRVSGQWALDKAKARSSISLDVQSTRLASLGVLDGIVLPESPMRLEAKVVQAADGVYRVPRLAIDALGGKVSGEMSYAPGPRPRVSIDLVASALDFRPLIATSEAAPVVDQPAASARPKRLIPDTKLPVEVLRQFDARLRLSASALHYPDPSFEGEVLVRDIELAADLERDRLDLERLSIDGDHGDLSIQGTLDASGLEPVLAMEIESEAFRFGALASDNGLELLPSNEIRFELNARGAGYRDVAATANGRMRLVGGKGQTANAGLDRKLGAFTYDLLSTVNPFTTREDHTAIDCWSGALVIQDGVLNLRPGFALRTDRIDITASGTIDLRTEAVDLNFRNAPRRGLGVSLAGLVRPYVAIGGDLAAPRLSFDTKGAIVSGTAAVATGGLSVLLTSLLDRASTAINPCESVIAAANEDRDLRSMNPLDVLTDSVRRSSPRDAPSGRGFLNDRN